MTFSVICHCFILEIVDTYQEKRQNSTTEVSLGAVDLKTRASVKFLDNFL
ncbi:MAG: hypothetical protein KZQ70_01325 [gamma proteobacterium symbiont of Lucinoma myriamae]|nr:hypothetical protein [gamma proteobacterium symbiont of Lucinoma myriamae]MCU7817540.1 hypothetical protein [gamma proteobacterium symbiont of Lucinoma myriamae]MCU7831182.1 hypothetical protein [gamma proteobacterium symbiont of Lucinoma myriamae]